VNLTYSPNIHIDSRTDRKEVEQIVTRVTQAGSAQTVESLRRARRI
jgi:hypothetical protein